MASILLQWVNHDVGLSQHAQDIERVRPSCAVAPINQEGLQIFGCVQELATSRAPALASSMHQAGAGDVARQILRCSALRLSTRWCTRVEIMWKQHLTVRAWTPSLYRLSGTYRAERPWPANRRACLAKAASRGRLSGLGGLSALGSTQRCTREYPPAGKQHADGTNAFRCSLAPRPPAHWLLL